MENQSLNTFFIRTFFFLNLLIPISLVSGPFLPDFFLVISNIIFIILLIRLKKFKEYFTNNFFIIFLIWCIYLILRSLFSDNIYLSLESSLFYFRFGLYSLGLMFLLECKSKFINYFEYFIYFILILLFIDSLLQIITTKNLIGYHYDGHRLSSFFDDEKILGSYITRILPILMAIFFLIEKKPHNVFLFFLIVFLTPIFVFLTGERVAFVNLILTMLIFIFYIYKYLYLKVSVLLISIISVTIISYNFPNIKDRMIDQTFDQLFTIYKVDESTGLNVEKKSFNFFSKTHEVYYNTALAIFKDNIYFGVGPQLYRVKCKDQKYYIEELIKITSSGEKQVANSCSTHPHSYYLQILSETGVIGFLPFFSFCIFILYKFLRFKISYFNNNFNYINSKILIYGIILINFFPLIPSGNFFNNWISIIMYIPIGFFLYFEKHPNKKTLRKFFD